MTTTTEVTYKVTYITCADHDAGLTEKVIFVKALDAIDAKHVAEATEGEVIYIAKARKVR